MSPQGPQSLTPQAEGAQGPPPSFGPDNSPIEEPKTCTVQGGDTLAEICQRYGRAGEVVALWEHNLGRIMDEQSQERFGGFQHMLEGGQPRIGWTLAIPPTWSEPQQPQPQAVQSDAEKFTALLSQLKEVASRLGVTI